MAKDVERLVLELSADISRMERGLKAGQRATDRALGNIERRFDTTAKKTARSAELMSSGIRNAIGGIALGAAIREVQQYADAWTRMGNPLRAAGLGQAEVNDQMDELVQLALRSRSSLEGTLTFYNRLTSASGELGLAQRDVLRIVETVNKALATSSLSGSERTSAVTQLVQGLGSGNLAGDELKAIRENALPIAQAIAKEFGVAVGELKKLGEEGKLTSARVAKALLDVSASTDAAFAKTKATIEDTFTNLGTKVTQFVGQMDAATGGTEKVAAVIGFVANNLDGFADAAGLAATVVSGALAGRAMTAALTSFVSLQAQIALTNAQLTAFEIRAGLAAGALGRMSAAGVAGSGAMRALSGSMAFLGGPIGLAIIAVAAGIYLLKKRADEGSAAMQALRRQTEINKTALDRYKEAVDLASRAQGEAKKTALELAEARRQETLQTIRNTQEQLTNARAVLAAARARQVASKEYQDSFAGALLATGGGMAGAAGQASVSSGRQADVDSSAAAVSGYTKELNDATEALKAFDAEQASPRVAAVAASDDKKTKGQSAETRARRQEAQRRRVEDVAAEEARAIAEAKNDADAIRSLEREASIRERQRGIIDASTDKLIAARTVQEALNEATEVQVRIDAARLEGQQRLIDAHNIERNISLAEIDENEQFLRQQKHRQELQELINFYQERGYDLITATASATSELAEIEQARADAGQRRLAEAQREDAITIARINAVTKADRQRVMDLEDQEEILRRIASYTTTEGGGLSREDARIRATREVGNIRSAENRQIEMEPFKEAAGIFIDGLREGDLKSVFSNLADSFADKLIDKLKDDLASTLYDALKGTGGGGSSGLSGFLSSIGSLFGGGRALGGPVKAGMAYRVNENTPNSEFFVPSQPGSIVPANLGPSRSKGGVTQVFNIDNRGAVSWDQQRASLMGYTDERAAQAGRGAVGASRAIIPAEQGRKARYSYTGR